MIKTKHLTLPLFTLFAGSALFAADIGVGSNAAWTEEGVIAGQSYTSSDKIHIRNSNPNEVPEVSFDFGAGNSTSVLAVVLGWANSNSSIAGKLTMDSGTLVAGGLSVGAPYASENPAEARESVFTMNAGTELIISGYDSDQDDFNALRIGRLSGGYIDGYHTLASATMTNAKLTFTGDLTNRTSLVSVAAGTGSIASLTATAGSVIRQNTGVSGTNRFAVRVAEGNSSDGTLTLSGAGTHLDLSTGGSIQDNDGFVIGYSQDSVGVVNVNDGAKISQSTSAAGAMRMVIGRGDNSSGTLNVDGAGTVVDFSSNGNHEVLQIGRGANATGTVNITNGARVTNENVGTGEINMYMGKSSGSNGAINISGTGSEFYFKSDSSGDGKNGGRLFVGSIGGATGNISISDGGRFDSYAKATVIGQNGGTGAMIIDNGTYISTFNNNPDFVIARTAGSHGTVEVKNGGSIECTTAALTIYLGGDWDNKNNGSVATALFNVHGQNSKIALTGNSSILVGYSKNSDATFELYDNASATVNNLGIALAEGSKGEFKMYGGATATVGTLGMGVVMTSSSQGISSALADISGINTALTVTGNMTVGTNNAGKTGSLKLNIGDGARVKVNGTLALNYGSDMTFQLGENDLLGSSQALLTAGTFAVGDLANVGINIDGSLVYAEALGDFQIYVLDYTTSALTQAQIESLITVNGFDSEYWNVGALEWDGNKLLLNLTALNFVPEPSAYAAMLGAVALAFAAYRRRR